MRFKHKHITSLMAFLTTCIIVIVLLLSGITVSAASPTNLTSLFQINSTVEYFDDNTSYNSLFIGSSDTNYITNYEDVFADGFSVPNDELNIWNESFTKYIITGHDYIHFYMCLEDSFILCDSQGHKYFTLNTLDAQSYPYSFQDFLNGSWFSEQRFLDSPPTQNTIRVEGVDYYKIQLNDYILSSDVPIYYTEDENLDNTSVIGSLDSFENLNGSAGNLEQDNNNLYFPSCDFQISSTIGFSQYLSGSDYGMDNRYNGSVNFTAQFTDYQNSHKDEFNLQLGFNVFFSMNGRTSNSSEKVINYNQSFTYSIPFTTFANNGYSQQYTIEQIFTDTGFKSFIDPYLFFSNVNNGSFVLTCSAIILPERLSTYDSGTYTEKYNFITKKSQTTNSSLNNNDNPYINDDTPVNSEEVNNTTNNNTSNNNTNNLTINNDYDSAVTSITNNLVQDNDTKNGLAQKLADNGDYDGFLGLFSSIFSFIPASFWTTLEKFMFVTFGILIAFVGIKCICDLL